MSSRDIDPIRVISRVRNNRLMVIREQMGMSVRVFAEWLGLSYGYYNNLENLSQCPTRKIMERLTEKLGSAADEAFPEYLQQITRTVYMRTIPEEQILSLESAKKELLLQAPDRPDAHAEIAAILNSGLSTLKPKEETAIRMYFGLGPGTEGEFPKREHTYSEIGDALGVGRERVRQIIERGLRRMRKPAISRPLSIYAIREHPTS